MAYRMLPLDSLVVNPANDRHGELENETAAIARLFALREAHMRNLTKDLVSKGEIFEPPLVYPEGDKFIVADGNRRTTCLKLLANAWRVVKVAKGDEPNATPLPPLPDSEAPVVADERAPEDEF